MSKSKARRLFNRFTHSSRGRLVRITLYLKHGGLCPCCGRFMIIAQRGAEHGGNDNTATFDHIVSLIDGGDPRDINNLAIMCKACNNFRARLEHCRKENPFAYAFKKIIKFN